MERTGHTRGAAFGRRRWESSEEQGGGVHLKAKGSICNERYDVNITFEYGGVERTACASIYPSNDGMDDVYDISPGDFEHEGDLLSEQNREEAVRVALDVAYAVYRKAVETGEQEVEVDV